MQLVHWGNALGGSTCEGGVCGSETREREKPGRDAATTGLHQVFRERGARWHSGTVFVVLADGSWMPGTWGEVAPFS